MIFCICLCVYNNEEGLPYVLKNVEKICSVYPCVVLVFYDESSDRSLEILTEWSERLPIRIVINPKKRLTPKKKLENICHARNMVLDILRSDYSDVPYFIMMDSNNYSCVGDINMDVLDWVMGRSDWDAISFDREAGYYDFWALSYYPFLYSFFHFTDYKVVLGMMQEDFFLKLENQKQKNINSCGDDLIVVCSAFNGFSIYRAGFFLNCSYDTKIDLRWFSQRFLKEQQRITGQNIIAFNGSDCEHRKFHLEAIRKNNARIRICVKSLFKSVGSDLSLNFAGPA
jgi:glycosyltransferase involved in cell wall biosynthesis